MYPRREVILTGCGAALALYVIWLAFGGSDGWLPPVACGFAGGFGARYLMGWRR